MIFKNLNQRFIVFFFVSSIHFFLCGNVCGEEKNLKNPVYIIPPRITIIVIPLIKLGDKNEVIDQFNIDIFKELIKTKKYNFLIIHPDDDKLEEIMSKGFIHRKDSNDNSLIKMIPSVDFWKDKGIDYIFYNSYKILQEDVVLEYRVYSIY